MHSLPVHNPYTGELLGTVEYASHSAIQEALNRATLAFQAWRKSSAQERSQLLENAAHELTQKRDEFVQMICKEAGKPLRFAQIEVDRGIGVLRWAASETLRYAGELLRTDVGISPRAGFGIHTRFPRGPVLGITPFNFPLNLALHKIAPAIACGCSILVKPSPATPLTTIKIQELFKNAPPWLLQILVVQNEDMPSLTQAPEIATLSFTGSAEVGHLLKRQSPLKPTLLELGGNAWVIIDQDTSREAWGAVAQKITLGGFGYAGQSCISVQNVAIHQELWEDFTQHLRHSTTRTPYGDPQDPATVSGPVINARAFQRIQGQLNQIPEGSEHISSETKKGNHSTPQNILSPSLLLLPSGSDWNHPLTQEEIFGPVVSARSFEKLDQVIQWMNSSRYGLQAGVFTQNWPTIHRLYQELQVGGLMVNDVPTTRYDHQPYGGVKDSGMGREGIKYAMDEMSESKFLALG